MSQRRIRENLLSTDNWPRRRKWMKIILGWTMLNAQYIIVFGGDSALQRDGLLALIALIAAIAGSYVFGAVWDDNDKRKWVCQHDDPPMGDSE